MPSNSTVSPAAWRVRVVTLGMLCGLTCREQLEEIRGALRALPFKDELTRVESLGSWMAALHKVYGRAALKDAMRQEADDE